MIRRIALITLFSLLLTPMSVTAAENLGYTWIEGDYVSLDIDGFDDEEDLIEDFDDGGGWAARGSFAFTESFFAFAGYSSTDSDVTFFDEDNFLIPAETDVKKLDAGLGFNMMLGSSESTQTDLVLRGAYTDVDFGNFDLGEREEDDVDDFIRDLDEDSSDGFYADARIRAQLAAWFEGSIGVRYTDIESVDNFSVVGNALFELTPRFGINLEADVGDEVSVYMLGLRYTLDRF